MASGSTPLALLIGLNEKGPRIRVPIRGGSVIVGRDPSNEACILDDPLVSRAHCVIRLADTGLVVEDLNSRNGTFLNEQRVTGAVPLPIPSTLTLGATRLAVIPTPSIDTQATFLSDDAAAVQGFALQQGSVLIPAGAVSEPKTEHLLVVDIIDSTRLVEQNDLDFAKAILTLGHFIQQGLRDAAEPFLQCTGDGFFACFSSAATALETATQLGPGLARYALPHVRASVALHWGLTRNTGNGGKAGRDVYAVFALDKIRHVNPELEVASRAPGNETFILMTEQFWSRLAPSTQEAARPVGAYHLRGLAEAVAILHWRRPPRTAEAAHVTSQASDEAVPGER